jgi:DNA-binding MarR family transcriptional regulator
MKAFADETFIPDTGLAAALVELAAQVVQLVRAEVRQVGAAGLAYSQVRSLRFLKTRPGAALSEVAEGLGLGAPTVSKAINELVEQGMVRRTGDCSDRRRVVLELTDEGAEALRRASSVAHARIARLLEPLDEAELDLVWRAIDILEPLLSTTECESGDE